MVRNFPIKGNRKKDEGGGVKEFFFNDKKIKSIW